MVSFCGNIVLDKSVHQYFCTLTAKMPFLLCNAKLISLWNHRDGFGKLSLFFQLRAHLEAEANGLVMVKCFLLHQTLFGTNINSNYAETFFTDIAFFSMIASLAKALSKGR
jgi:hypothetical protein